MKTGTETLQTNRTKWQRELRHPNAFISNKHESIEIPHKTKQEDIGQARRARELTHSTRINRIEHATIQNGYYYSVASTTGCYYYGWLLLQVASVSYFTWGPQSEGNFLVYFTWGPNSDPREIHKKIALRTRAAREIRYRMATTTDDYYYYHALHYLNVERSDEVAAILKKWRRSTSFISEASGPNSLCT